MRYHMRPSSIELLEPRTVAERRALYDLVRQALGSTGAPVYVVRLLALAAVRHLSGHGGRILLSGEDSRGQLTLVRTLAETLDLPFLEIDVGSLAETNWRGSDLPFYLERLHAQLEQRHARATVPRIAERACILLAHLERLRLPGAYTGSSSTRDYREGKALSLCPLAGEGLIPVSKESGGYLWPSKRALVIATAQLDGLPRVPDAEALELWGIPRPLADELAAFTWIEFAPPDRSALYQSMRSEVRAVVNRFLAFHYHLRIDEQVVRYLVDLVASGARVGGVRAAVAVVSASADRILARMLDEDAPAGTVYVFARDDIDRSTGELTRGTWRE